MIYQQDLAGEFLAPRAPREEFGPRHRRLLERRSNARARSPGWICSRRAWTGIRHKRSCFGIGYSATQTAYLTAVELAGHGLVMGTPHSGKTTALHVLIEASADRVRVVVEMPEAVQH